MGEEVEHDEHGEITRKNSNFIFNNNIPFSSYIFSFIE